MYLKDFRNKIIEDINLSKLDTDMVYFVMKDIMAEITTIYNNEVFVETQKENIEDVKEKEEK